MYIETAFKNVSQVPLYHEISFVPTQDSSWNVKLLDSTSKEKHVSENTEIFHIHELKSHYLLQGASRRYLFEVFDSNNPDITPDVLFFYIYLE